MQIQNDLQSACPLLPPPAQQLAAPDAGKCVPVTYLAKLSWVTPDHLNQAKLSWRAPWDASGPQNYEYILLHSQSCSLSSALLALAVAQLRKFKPSGKDGRKTYSGRSIWVVNTVALLLTFFPLVSGWEELRDDKILSCCLFKTKLQNPRMTLLYSLTHIQFYEFTFMHKNLHMWRDWLTMTSWIRWFHFYRWKNSPVYN